MQERHDQTSPCGFLGSSLEAFEHHSLIATLGGPAAACFLSQQGPGFLAFLLPSIPVHRLASSRVKPPLEDLLEVTNYPYMLIL